MPDANAPPSADPRFDVVLRLPAGRRLDEVEQLALAAGVRPEHVDALVTALKAGPFTKVGAGVNSERAERARDQFTRAGLTVEVTPVLTFDSSVAASDSGLTACPACGRTMRLTETRQCSACGVFVDKVSEEDAMRRKLREQERSALEFRAARDKQSAEKNARVALEARLRKEIRKELQKTHGEEQQVRRNNVKRGRRSR